MTPEEEFRQRHEAIVMKQRAEALKVSFGHVVKPKDRLLPCSSSSVKSCVSACTERGRDGFRKATDELCDTSAASSTAAATAPKCCHESSNRIQSNCRNSSSIAKFHYSARYAAQDFSESPVAEFASLVRSRG